VDQTIRTIEADSGEAISYATVGSGPLLVLAAWWTSHLELDWQDPAFRSFIETLAQRHTVVRYDRPGVGLSDRGDRRYDLDGETDYLGTVVDAACRDADVDEFDLLGISCGGPASVRLAVERPDSVRNLVLYASYLTGTSISDQPTRDALTDLVRANWGMGSTTLTSLLLPGADAAAVRRFNRAQRDTATADVAAALLDLTFQLDASPYAEQVDVPTLVLHRAHDHVIECALGRQLAERIPGAEYHELEGKVHVPWTGDCSESLDRIESFLTGAGSVVPPRRRLATVCFVDVVDSTRMLAEIGDARWRERQDQLHLVLTEDAEARGGTVVKDTGDGALLTFDLPRDAFDFARAVRPRASAIDLQLRIGVHTGEVEQRDDDITGIAVVIASRVADLCEPGQILATATTAELAAGSGIEVAAVGSRDLKGIAGERSLVEVAPAGAASTTVSERNRADSTTIRFGEFEIDAVGFELRRAGTPVTIEPQVFEVLRYLAERAGQLVAKEQLLDDVWGDRFVSESSLSSRIRSARAAVGDDGQKQQTIKTVHGRGFRFVAPID
jgi:class 3 adenylate cyclase